MMRDVITFSFWSGWKVGALLVGTAVGAASAEQGQRFDRPPSGPLPSLPRVVDLKTKFEGPKLDPVNLGTLLGRGSSVVEIPRTGPLMDTVAPVLYAEFVGYVRQFEAEQAARAGVPARNEAAVALVQSDRHAEAIAELLAIEVEFPNLAQTAMSLGLVCEFAGKLEEAVLWTARGIERRTPVTGGTEWLHLSILRAKLKLREDDGWLKNHSVLEDVADANEQEVLHAIDRELEERLQFVKPVDAILCDLFYQAALRVKGPKAAERRAHYLRESLRYGEWRKAAIAALPATR